VEQAKVMSQVAVGRKENEIRKAPEALKKVEISRKIITADAMHFYDDLSQYRYSCHGSGVRQGCKFKK
jgi:predicted transposase YbfD/YdcC